MDLDDQQTLEQRIKQFLAQNSQFRSVSFDPAPFLIQILKEKQSNHEAILQRRKQLIQIENECFDLVDEVCSEYSQDFIKLLSIPQQQGQILQKLKSSMSMVKKKTKQTKNLLLATQKDIDQVYFNCVFNKSIYKKVKQIELKIYQYESASMALKNNQFLNCSMNLPIFQGHSILESALAGKAQNLRLQLLSRAIEEVGVFLYLTPKMVLPTAQTLIDRAQNQKQVQNSLKKHEGFKKRYNLFKKAFCLQYLPTLWSFKELQRQPGKIHLIFDIIQGILNIGKIQQILQSLELDCRKSISNIFLLLLYYFSEEQQPNSNQQTKFSLQQQKHSQKQNFSKNFYENPTSNQWFMCQQNQNHKTFVSVILDVVGVMVRKLIILRLILKQFMVQVTEFRNLNLYNFYQLILKQINQLLLNVYITQERTNMDFIHEEIIKKLFSTQNYIHWIQLRNLLAKSLILIEENIQIVQQQYELKDNYQNVKWDQVIKIQDFERKFYARFDQAFKKTLQEIFSHSGRSFALESLQEIISSKTLDDNEINFCKFFTSEEMSYSKEYIFTISLFASLQRYFSVSPSLSTKLHRYQLFLLSVLYLKLNYYLQKLYLSQKSLKKAYDLRKTSSKLKTKEKDFKREYNKLYVKKKEEPGIQPIKKLMNQEVIVSKYSMVQNLKGIQKQNQMLLSYCVKNIYDLQKYKDSQNVLRFMNVYDKLEPTNYDENFSSKLTRIKDQLPQIDTSIAEMTLSLFQKFIELHMVIVSVIYLQSSTE